MNNFFKAEWLKTKRSTIKKLVIIFPILIILITTLLFYSTGSLIQSILNQWSLVWTNFFIALIAGLMNYYEKKATQYKIILSSYINLKKYETIRLLIALLHYLFGTIIFSLLLIFLNSITTNNLSWSIIIETTLGIFILTIWQIPLYLWLSRVTNIYISILFSFCTIFIEILTNNLKYGIFWPFTWPAFFTVPLIHLNINGTISSSGVTNHPTLWFFGLSLLLFIITALLLIMTFMKEIQNENI